MIDRIRNLGGRVVHPITLPKYNELKYKGTDLVMTATREILFGVNPNSSHHIQVLKFVLQSRISPEVGEDQSSYIERYCGPRTSKGLRFVNHSLKSS